ncbi:hypothetical protein RFY98_05780, partial [Acinetobacter baumannii]|nr:hypothetical protein [Acinetobacter baumannii]
PGGPSPGKSGQPDGAAAPTGRDLRSPPQPGGGAEQLAAAACLPGGLAVHAESDPEPASGTGAAPAAAALCWNGGAGG